MTEAVNRRLPKYHQVADAIRRQIRAGELAPGDRLPAETVIATTHATSVPTIRQAMGVLRAEGLIESRHGIGTFIRQDSRLQRRSGNRYGEARGRDGLLNNRFRHHITAAGIEPAPHAVAALIGIETDQPIVVRRRDLYDDSDQLQEIGASYLPAEFAAGTHLAEPTVVPKALFRCVEDITGRRYAHATDQWIARPASVEEAERFNLNLGAYVLHVTHAARDEDGRVLEVSESIWPADRVSLIEDYEIPAVPDQTATGSDI